MSSMPKVAHRCSLRENTSKTRRYSQIHRVPDNVQMVPPAKSGQKNPLYIAAVTPINTAAAKATADPALMNEVAALFGIVEAEEPDAAPEPVDDPVGWAGDEPATEVVGVAVTKLEDETAPELLGEGVEVESAIAEQSRLISTYLQNLRCEATKGL
jgi:hypothetical protein